ncbi:MAG TPA: hypothetical protein VH740_15285 [Vicinamibacterales bacterium]
MEALFYASPWPGLVLWIALYTSDFLMTMTCARLYQRGARERIAFEGSYEITPYYQGDVDALRLFSPRFLFAMAATCAIQATLWFFTMRSQVVPEAYVFAVGMMVMIQLTIHVRHIRNLFLFRAVLAGDQIKGRIEYGRPAMLRLSAVELFTFAGVYAILFAITLSWFILGGVVICAAMALNHRALATKHIAKATAA